MAENTAPGGRLHRSVCCQLLTGHLRCASPLPHTPALLPLPSTRLARPHLPGAPLLSHTPPLGQPPPNSTFSAPSGFLASGVFRGLARAAPLPVASFTHQSLGAPHVGLSYPRTLGRGSCGSSCLLPPIVTGSLAVETAWTFLELLGWREGNRMRARRGGKPRLALASARSRESPQHSCLPPSLRSLHKMGTMGSM